MRTWLEQNIGRVNHAWHSGGSYLNGDRCAIYFRDPSAAAAFAAAFPDFPIADGTVLPTYSSPFLPFGRARSYAWEDEPVCNLYSMTRANEAMRQLFADRPWSNLAGNLEPGSVYPDQMGAIIRHDTEGGLELARARWGMPTPSVALKTARDPGVTNVRNTGSTYWRPWLGPRNRCLVPVTSFAEPKPGGNQWFAPTNPAQQIYFAGIELRGWKSVRKVKDGPTTDDLYAFLTCEPNAEVGAIHPKAMPVILTTREECETWLDAPIEIALRLQRPLPDRTLEPCAEPI